MMTTRGPDVSLQTFCKHLLPKMLFSPGHHILDVGCLDELWLNTFRQIEKQANKQLFDKYVGIDIDEKGMKEAQERSTDSRAHYQLGDITKELPFEKDTFDTSLCIGTLGIIPFEELQDSLNRLFHITKHTLVFDFFAFRDPEISSEKCLKQEGKTSWDYFIYNSGALLEKIDGILAANHITSEVSYASTPLSSQVSESITGEKGKEVNTLMFLIQ